MFSLESPHRGDSNEYTKYTIFNIEQEGHDGPGLLTWVSCEPRIFNLTDFGIKQAKVIILTNNEESVSSF